MKRLSMSAESIEIRKATMDDRNDIIALIDGEFTTAGFGFVNGAQVETEIGRHNVWVACNGDEIVGVRVGGNTIWNLVVAKGSRRHGIGRALIDAQPPQTIRVKALPVGHLSKEQREMFESPEPFYASLGYRLWGRAFPRNFWQRAGDKAQYHAKGSQQHILIYRDPRATLPEGEDA